jgi:CHAT domain-containing protein
VFDPERPLDARLRLGREAVRASELFGVKLDAALACFSACDVGAQAERFESVDLVGDEWLGLAIPLLYAGARTILVSLWPANSEQTTTLMQGLHRELSRGRAPAEAFQLAVASVQDDPVAHWANWYFAGLPTNVPLLATASTTEDAT